MKRWIHYYYTLIMFLAFYICASIAVAAISMLTGCGSDTHIEYRDETQWPYTIPYTLQDYFWIDATINGIKQRCIFDTGAPATFINPDVIRSSAATICAGNFCSDIAVFDLRSDMYWVGCLLGWPWLDAGGITDLWFDTKASVLRGR